jgi:hypothetical protein
MRGRGRGESARGGGIERVMVGFNMPGQPAPRAVTLIACVAGAGAAERKLEVLPRSHRFPGRGDHRRVPHGCGTCAAWSCLARHPPSFCCGDEHFCIEPLALTHHPSPPPPPLMCPQSQPDPRAGGCVCVCGAAVLVAAAWCPQARGAPTTGASSAHTTTSSGCFRARSHRCSTRR